MEQGEGARGDWRNAHFGRLVTVLDEFLDLRDADPGFEPSRPVLAALVREREDGLDMPLISDAFTSRSVDLLNASYEVILQVLARYFAHTDESDDQLGVLAEVAVGLMRFVVKPLGGLVTRLPVGFDQPGRTAGPTFELFYGVDYLLPHREAAWAPLFLPIVARVADDLILLADQLGAAR